MVKLPDLPMPFKKQGQQMAYDGYDKVFFDCYDKAQMQAFYKKGYEQAMLDAMNATLPFGKTGAVIAAAIGALK